MRPQEQRKEFRLFSKWNTRFYFFLLSPGNTLRSTKRNSCLIPGGNSWQDLIRGHLSVACKFRKPPPEPPSDLDKDLSPQSPMCKNGDGTLEGHPSALRAALLLPRLYPCPGKRQRPCLCPAVPLAWCRERHRLSCCKARSSAWVPAAAPTPWDLVTTAHSQAPPGPPELPCFSCSPRGGCGTLRPSGRAQAGMGPAAWARGIARHLYQAEGSSGSMPRTFSPWAPAPTPASMSTRTGPEAGPTSRARAREEPVALFIQPHRPQFSMGWGSFCLPCRSDIL